MRMTKLGPLLLVVVAGACYSTGGTGGADAPPRDPNLISYQELIPVSAITVYEAIERLRPAWMRRRAGQTPTVFVNGAERGGLSELRDWRAEQLQEIRFISAADATSRWGTGYPSGVIELISRGE